MIGSYFLQSVASFVRAMVNRGRVHKLGDYHIYSNRVWITDIDLYLHVNNGRYLTLLDFGRVYYGTSIGMTHVCFKKRWRPLLVRAHVQFKKEVRFFEKYEIWTRLVETDHKFWYLEQKFVNPDNGALYAWAIVQGIVKQTNGKTVTPAEIFAELGIDLTQLPAASKEISTIIEAMQLTSNGTTTTTSI